jgi:Flp pilus assembly protein TadG
MRNLLARLRQDRRGSPSVDFALTLPALVLMTVGVMQLGIAFLANAGLRAGVEAGARYATVFLEATRAYPTDAQVQAKVTSSVFGINTTQLSTPTIARGTTAGGEDYVDVTATYPVKFNFVFFSTPQMTLTYTRRAYQL